MEIVKVVAALLDIVLRLVGPEKAKAELSLAEARFAQSGADAAELAKFGKVSN